MPTYDYRCQNCQYEFEKFQSIKAGSLRKCPKCKNNTLKRLLGTGAGVIFKGSGFYETDYRSDSYKKAAESEKKSAEQKKEEKKTDTKETKPANKATPKSEPKTKSD